MSTEVTAASLQVGPREIDQWLSRLDETNPAHRAIALDALEGLIKEYILPAMDLPLSPTRFDVFDLDAVAGEHVPGLVQNLFDQRMNGLHKPVDEQLKEALDYIEVKTTSSEQREKFFLCWAGNKASLSIRTLLNFLRKPLLRDVPPQLKAAAPEEQRRLTSLLKYRLPEEITYQLSTTIERLEQLSS
ncbi:MAG: hypothetical protein QOD00_1369 [Blastocatellia bacterium]|jgi:hypothetical protein|nr:hypothetical protein [Blastocatellia bacterium]